MLLLGFFKVPSQKHQKNLFVGVVEIMNEKKLQEISENFAFGLIKISLCDGEGGGKEENVFLIV